MLSKHWVDIHVLGVQKKPHLKSPSTINTYHLLQMQRLYGKYLKAESFRKALVYQKKYLLLLLGGFQDCEETTLALIARMGAHPTVEEVQRQQNRRPTFLFRSAVRVVIAVSR